MMFLLQESHAETFKKYEALCRGENRDSISQNPKLKCSYTTRNDWYLLIGPLKQEKVNLDPLIVLFHDVIHDDEIRTIQNLAIPDVMQFFMKYWEKNLICSGDINNLLLF